MANDLLYGFHNLKDLANERVTEVGVDVVDRAVTQAVEEYNRQMDALTTLFATQTTDYKTRFKSVTASRLQPLDNDGRARKIKPSGYYDVSLPLFEAGTAWGANYVTMQKMTVMEANRATAAMILSDRNWMRDNILGALFANASYTFADPEHGSLSVSGLANGDSVTYQIQEGASAGATDDHYYAQANAIGDGADNPFPNLYDELTEHPENMGDVVVFVASSLVDDIEALTNFKERSDDNIREGANTDVLTGNLNVATPGTVIGYVDKCWIVEWKSLPAGYMIGVSTEGERPLAMRVDPEPTLVGFNRVADRVDHPFYESQYLRRAGFGGWNRAGAIVYRIGNGTYAVPSGYSMPIT